jgi:hypothetical protein
MKLPAQPWSFKFDFSRAGHRKGIDDTLHLARHPLVLLNSQQNMRRPTPISDEYRATFCGLLGPARILIEFTAR